MKLQRKKRKLDVMGRGNTKKESVFPRTGILGTFGCKVSGIFSIWVSDLNRGLF